MWFRKKSENDDAPFAGAPVAAASRRILHLVLDRAMETWGSSAYAKGSDSITQLEVPFSGSAESVMAWLNGIAATGVRGSAWLPEVRQSTLSHGLSEAARMHLPVTFQVDNKVLAGSHHHDILPDAGGFFLAPSTPQEVIDLILIGQWLAEQSLVPGVSINDVFSNRYDVDTLVIPDPELVGKFLGKAGDRIESPTPSQQMLFGAERRRVPRWIDGSRPAATGFRHGKLTGWASATAQAPFFLGHVDELFQKGTTLFGQLTGRRYQAIEEIHADGAEIILVAMGSICRNLQLAIESVRANTKLKIGLLKILRPFPLPEASILKVLQNARTVVTVESASSTEPRERYLARSILALRGLQTDTDSRIRKPRNKDGSELRIRHAVIGPDSTVDEVASLIMQAAGDSDSSGPFMTGMSFHHSGARLPKLERTEQLLKRDYSDFFNLNVDATGELEDPFPAAIEIWSRSHEDGPLVGGALAAAFFGTSGGRVTGRETDLRNGGFRKSRYRIWLSEPSGKTTGRVALVTSARTLGEVEFLESLKPEATVLLLSDSNGKNGWEDIPPRVQSTFDEKRIRRYSVDVSDLTEESFGAIYLLIGCYISMRSDLDDSSRQDLVDRFSAALESSGNIPDSSAKRLSQVLVSAASRLTEAGSFTRDDTGALELTEPESPAIAREEANPDGSVFDPVRAWDSVGYLYRTGRSNETLVDPHLAAHVVPARTASFNPAIRFRETLPQVVTENCTACGLCWTVCPEGAIRTQVQPVSTLVETAFRMGKQKGVPIDGLIRFEKQISGQAHRLFKGDDLNAYRKLGDLLRATMDFLLPKMNLDEDASRDLRQQAENLARVAEDLPLIRTNPFLFEPEEMEKGTGKVFSLAIDPDACTACGICTEVCTDDALETETDGGDGNAARIVELLDAMPELTAIDTQQWIENDDPSTNLFRLLERSATVALEGNDGHPPGSGVKATLRMVFSVAEAVTAERRIKLVSAIRDKRARLQDLLQTQLREPLQLNDFEAFRQSLSSIDTRNLTLENLGGLASESGVGPDTAYIKLITETIHSLQELERRLRADREDQPDGRFCLVRGVVDSTIFPEGVSRYPFNSFSVPWISADPDHVMSLATGIFEGSVNETASIVSLIRRSDAILKNARTVELPSSLGWDDLTKAEREFCPLIIVVTGSGQLNTTGFPPTRVPIKTVYLDTGSQWESGRREYHENLLVGTALSRPDLFVMNGTVGLTVEAVRGLVLGMQGDEAAIIQLYASDPDFHGFDPKNTFRRMREAVENRVISFWIKPAGQDMVADAVTLVGSQEGEWSAEAAATWFRQEWRFKDHFKSINPIDTNSVSRLNEYLHLSEDKRSGRIAGIEITGPTGRNQWLSVSAEMVRILERLEKQSLFLASLSPRAERISQPVPASGGKEPETLVETRTLVPEEIKSVLANRLLKMSGFDKNTESGSRTLHEYIAAKKSDPSDGNEER